jgi:hypothetical protein
MLPIKKIYVDSREKTPDSKSHSDFFIDLPTTYLMPEDTGFYLEDIVIPVSWYPVTNFFSNALYIEVSKTGSTTSGTGFIITVSPGSYSTESLGTEIVAKMNTAFNGTGATAFLSTYVPQTKRFLITHPTWTFKIYADNDAALLATMKTTQVGTSGQYTKAQFLAQSMNDLIKNTYNSYTSTFSKKFTSGYVDMIPLRNLYIHAIGLGNFNSTNLSGARSIIKKVPINASYGEVIIDQYATGLDFNDCSHQTLSRIGFKLTDHEGTVIDLNGFHWSFSIVFSRTEMGD